MKTKTLRQMQAEVAQVNHDKGWYDRPRPISDDIALLHSEVSEMLEAYRRWGYDDMTDMTDLGSTPKPEGLGSEVADVLIRLLDFVERREIDLDFEYERKIEYNRTRPYRHGGKRL
jgi:NTP pyrophosphatase (non-canonical NTP hydrolase)